MKRDSDIHVTNDSSKSDSDSEIEEDPHSSVWKDALYLRVDPNEEKFKQDVSTALSLSEHSIAELRLFISLWIRDETDLCAESTMTTSFESILSKFPTISRLFIHAGFYYGNGLTGFKQASAETLFARGRLTTISSNILPLFAKHKIPLKTLCIGGYKSLDGDWGTYQGSEVTPSEVFDPELPSHAFEQLESFDIGISVPISQTNSSEEQDAEMTTQAHAIARFVGRLPALKDLSLRWDQPYHEHEQTPPLVQKEFPSRVLASLGRKCKLQRLRLRGFTAVTRAPMRSFLCQNAELEHIEIGSWSMVSGAWLSHLHYIKYSLATSKYATGAVKHSGDRPNPHYEITKWTPTGCVTVLSVGTNVADAEMERNEAIAPPTERCEGVDRVLNLLTTRRLVMFVDVAGDANGVPVSDAEAEADASAKKMRLNRLSTRRKKKKSGAQRKAASLKRKVG